MNIAFCYLYRYSPHITEYHEVVLSNTKHIPLTIIENIITSHLTANRSFIPDVWQLPNLYSMQAPSATPPHHVFLYIMPLPATPAADGDIVMLLHTILLQAAIHSVQ